MENILKTKVAELEKNIFAFYQMVKNQHFQAVKFLQNHQIDQLQQIIEIEKKIDLQYDFLLKSSFYSLARYSFFGSHLRKVLSYSYIANELERIGDYGEDISKSIIKSTFTAQQIQLLVDVWKKLLDQFEKVEKLFFLKDIKVLLVCLQTWPSKKIHFQSLIKQLETSAENDAKKVTHQTLSFFSEIHAIDRSFARLNNIVEYLLLIRSFSEFWKYRKNHHLLEK